MHRMREFGHKTLYTFVDTVNFSGERVTSAGITTVFSPDLRNVTAYSILRHTYDTWTRERTVIYRRTE